MEKKDTYSRILDTKWGPMLCTSERSGRCDIRWEDFVSTIKKYKKLTDKDQKE